MNFLLLDRGELDADGTAVLHGRRAAHARDVLGVAPGRALRAGVLGGPLGTAEVLAVEGDRVTVRVTLGDDAGPRPRDTLLVAVPRPKVLLRMIAHAAALGFGELVLFRSWRVDKSWLDSSAMQPAAWHEQLLLGLEQAGRPHLPRVRYFPRFKPMVEDELPRLGLPDARFVAHPGAPTPTWQLAMPEQQPFALALGPDGGFLPYEVDKLREAGFFAVHCGPHPLRTETALAVLAGQLQLLRRQGAGGCPPGAVGDTVPA
ncbi:MAG: 16S rRNA (uracil(1498)-N(3))-methyltransferase [Planctomycetes bacterium]|nr:16S rRNA (uracil(1498)-N(3))-methyltransferase [Planctomycetota bacterium]